MTTVVPPEELIAELYTGSSTLPGPFQELNESFLLSSAYLVFFMHCGFAMVSLNKDGAASLRCYEQCSFSV